MAESKFASRFRELGLRPEDKALSKQFFGAIQNQGFMEKNDADPRPRGPWYSCLLTFSLRDEEQNFWESYDIPGQEVLDEFETMNIPNLLRISRTTS
ncbi:MAG: hypothetical protein ABA06_03265 [Parcubacteria bacterium C7867-001]|nr:MAG: hypothetical protein ABA06_03265 [Parcubacteria bacterium C7867-001]